MVFTIDDFEGPLDLLLHLIKEDNIDICDISIARITEQYLDYIIKMQNMNLDIASSYLVMAGELIEFKSKSLLPNVNIEEVTEEFKEEIVNKLYDYKEYKEFSEELKHLASERSLMFDKAPSDCHEFVSYDEYKNIGNAVDLSKALERVLQNLNDMKPTPTKITYKEYSVYERSLEIKKIIFDKKKVLFNDLFNVKSKDYVVVTFLSILDLARNNEIKIEQENNFSDIYLLGGTI